MVLILVVVEDGLREIMFKLKGVREFSLNPCCGGRWSQRLISSGIHVYPRLS